MPSMKMATKPPQTEDVYVLVSGRVRQLDEE
jgi:hypothetical protein